MEKKNLGGRPSKLDEEMYNKAELYISGDWEITGDLIPSMEALAIYLNVSRSTVKLWASSDERFSAITDVLKATQAVKVMNKGLSGDFNSTISKVILAQHGITEKTEVHNTVSLEALSDEELKMRLQTLLS
jgi:hypothetical protein